MTEPSDKAAWASQLPNGTPLKDQLAPLVDDDHDEAEIEYYEAVADPVFATIEREQRRFRAMFRRRVRHREAKRRGGAELLIRRDQVCDACRLLQPASLRALPRKRGAPAASTRI